jgi:transcriptional regulator with XRE-family HTH domain
MAQDEMPPYAARLRTAREQTGRSIDDMAALLGITREAYWDLESYDDEVLTCLSIEQVAVLCRTLGMAPRTLFAEESSDAQGAINLEVLGLKIKAHLQAEQMDLSAFEERVGWDVATWLERPQECFTTRYPVEALRDICQAIGVNWVAALSAIACQRPDEDA